MARKSFKDRVQTNLKTIKSPTFNLGFTSIDRWVSMGNFALNRLMSGRFDKGLLFGRNYILYGESGSGKSLQMAYVCANAQKEHEALIVWIDVEKATDDVAGMKWLARAGVDVEGENFIFTTAATLGDIKSIISNIATQYRKEIQAGEEDVKPIIFVVDSWSASLTEKQFENATKGEMTGDMGQKAKQTGDVVLAATHLVGGLPIMVIGTMHVMDNQDGYGRKHKTTGGNKAIYMASGCLMLTKKELNVDDVDSKEVVDHYKTIDEGLTADLKKKKKFVGITCNAEILKSRVSKPFEKIELQIPWLTGLDPYSGLFDLLMQEGLIYQSAQGWYAYKTSATEEVKFRKKDFRDHADFLMRLADQDISGVEEAAPSEESVTEDTEEELPEEAQNG